MPPASASRAGVTPEASRDRSSGTFGKTKITPMQYYALLNEQQTGPYTRGQLSAMWKSGSVTGSTLIWYEGLTEWIPISSIEEDLLAETKPQISPLTPPQQQRAATTSRDASATPSTQERELWSGTPSHLLNLKLYIIWLFVFGATLFGGLIQREILMALVVFVPLCAVQCLFAVFKIRATRYVVTTQRVRTVRGIFSKDIQEIELFRVKDTATHQTLFLRLFGLGSLKIISGDSSNPNLTLSAIPKPNDLREQLRREVLALRQRYNVRELDVM